MNAESQGMVDATFDTFVLHYPMKEFHYPKAIKIKEKAMVEAKSEWLYLQSDDTLCVVS